MLRRCSPRQPTPPTDLPTSCGMLSRRCSTVRSAPRRSSTSTSSRWLSREAATAKRDQRRLERREQQELRNIVSRRRYRRACRFANQLINESRRDHFFRTRLQDCANDPGKRWRVVKELLHTSACDNRATNAENRDLRFTFSDFFFGSK